MYFSNKDVKEKKTKKIWLSCKKKKNNFDSWKNLLQIPQNPTKNYHFLHLYSPEDMTATKHPLSFPIPISCDDWINDRVFSLKKREGLCFQRQAAT